MSDNQQDSTEEVKAKHNPPRERVTEICDQIQMYLATAECDGATVVGIVDVDGKMCIFRKGNSSPHSLGLATLLADNFRFVP